jgi:3-phosphoshikimate 1-carboxyvinyltransferase
MICPTLQCKNNCIIRIKTTTPLVSQPYIRITLEVLNSFGITIQEKIGPDDNVIYVLRCGQIYRPQVYQIPGDFSSIAFLVAATILTKEDSELVIQNLDFQKPQGDVKFIEIVKKMGANIEIEEDNRLLKVHGNIDKHPLSGIRVDCRNIPDLFPILSVIGAFARGKMTLYNASHLRHKESDRIAVVSRELKKFGVKVEENHDSLVVHHSSAIKGSVVNHENDHRIAMSFIVASLFASNSSIVSNIEVMSDSYPDFLKHLQQIGAKIEIKQD